jgi:hypothetical protein
MQIHWSACFPAATFQRPKLPKTALRRCACSCTRGIHDGVWKGEDIAGTGNHGAMHESGRMAAAAAAVRAWTHIAPRGCVRCSLTCMALTGCMRCSLIWRQMLAVQWGRSPSVRDQQPHASTLVTCGHIASRGQLAAYNPQPGLRALRSCAHYLHARCLIDTRLVLRIICTPERH